MSRRLLRLGTRRSALARAQSAAIAARLRQLHPDLEVELVGIDTRGDRITDRPLTQVEGKEFFTAEIDAALLSGDVDCTVHSYKDLSLDRQAVLQLAAVPRREWPQDIVLFAPEVPARLAAGAALAIGSSSPRRAAFVPDFLERVLPAAESGRFAPGMTAVREPAPRRVQLRELRGNVDTRLRRLREPPGSERHLDGIVLALAGLARLWQDQSGRLLLRELLDGLPRMLLPLSVCPSAPAQGALALECRADDADTFEILRAIDDPATRHAVDIERALLAQRGGGCHQRFGATQITAAGLGTLLYVREADERGSASASVRWSPELPLPPPSAPVVAWDGNSAEKPPFEMIPEAASRAQRSVPIAPATFIAHRRAVSGFAAAALNTCPHLWVPGVETWASLAAEGVWIEGCADGLGFAALQPLLAEPVLQLPPVPRWTALTYEGAEGGWPTAEVIATYRHLPDSGAAQPLLSTATHIYWSSTAQFNRWRLVTRRDAHHACGPGKTYEFLRGMQLAHLNVFPSPAQWREWLEI
ncbi:MAG: hypothetical protein ACHQAR_01705 [Steroidobacterales bacterium]